MKWIDKYPLAWTELERCDGLRQQVATLKAMAAKTEACVQRTTARLNRIGGKGSANREDALCDYIDLQPQILKAERELDTAVQNIEKTICMLADPREELLLRMIYINGADKHVIMAMAGMSPSGFRAKLERAVASYEKLMSVSKGGVA